MLKKIEALRKQPKYIRNRYAFWSALGVTLLIVSIWALTIPARFSSTDIVEDQNQNDLSVFAQKISDVIQSSIETMTTAKSNVEYAREEPPTENTENTLDFETMFATSSAEKNATSTQQGTSTIKTETSQTPQ
jgi:hypothetical protein